MMMTPFFILFLLVTRATAHIYIDDYRTDCTMAMEVEQKLTSVAYFDWDSTEYWPDVVLRGNLDTITLDREVKMYNPEFNDDDIERDGPNFLLAPLSIANNNITEITQVASKLNAEFIILWLNDDDSNTWQARLKFWWTRKIPEVPFERCHGHAAPPFFLAVQKDVGQVLMDLVTNETQQKWHGDCGGFVVGFDDESPIKGRDLVAKALFGMVLFALIIRWLCNSNADTRRDAAQYSRHFTANDLGQGEIQTTAQDCAICLETMPIGTAVRILPCRHCFHYDCIDNWLSVQANGRQRSTTCPLCKFDLLQHFQERDAARIQVVSCNRNETLSWLFGPRRMWQRWRGVWANQDSLLEEDGGDLELTIDDSVSTSSEHIIS